jgi:hypothetical protein
MINPKLPSAKQLFLFLNLILILGNAYGQNKRDEFLIKQLDSINIEDQAYRNKLEVIRNRYGGKSQEMKDLWTIIHAKDSLNLIKVEAILQRYGWLGTDVVGHDGNSTLFLVIQHSDLATQEKYLPMMRDAVDKGNAEARSVALLEDRIAIRKGKRQLYGSQIGWDMVANQYFVLPLDDPDNVDKRRLNVGLLPLADYIKNWQLKWDVEQYKTDLPLIEKRMKEVER